MAMRGATTAYHQGNDSKTAFALLDGLSSRLGGSTLPGLADQSKLAADLRTRAAFYAGYGGELPRSLSHLLVVGRWEITGADGFDDLHKGDRLEFTPDREMLTFRKDKGLAEAEDLETYEINEREVHLTISRMVLRYAATSDRMTMRTDNGSDAARLTLRRIRAN